MIFMIFLRFQLVGTELEAQDYKGKKSVSACLFAK